MSEKIMEVVQAAYQQALEQFFQSLIRNLEQITVVETVSTDPPRRGRPRKIDKLPKNTAPKKRGRPPKGKKEEITAPKKRGRPPKVKAEVIMAAPKRGRGRPRKIR